MGRNNTDWNPTYTGEELFYSAQKDADIAEIEWATDSATFAEHIGMRQYGDCIAVYTVTPVDPEDTHVVYGGYIGRKRRTLVKHYTSEHGFVVTGVHHG